jgi:hypothetical protein
MITVLAGVNVLPFQVQLVVARPWPQQVASASP